MRDREADARVNKNTLAVVLGENRVKTYHTLLVIFAFVSAIAYFGLKAKQPLDYIPLIAFIPLFLNVIKVYKTKSAMLLDPELKKVALSTFLFALLFFLTAYL